eukprot:GSA25T00008977001.1
MAEFWSDALPRIVDSVVEGYRLRDKHHTKSSDCVVLYSLYCGVKGIERRPDPNQEVPAAGAMIGDEQDK